MSPFVQFVFDLLKERSLPIQGKEMCFILMSHGLSTSTLRNWKDGASPELKNYVKVLDGLGFELQIVAKEPKDEGP